MTPRTEAFDEARRKFDDLTKHIKSNGHPSAQQIAEWAACANAVSMAARELMGDTQRTVKADGA